MKRTLLLLLTLLGSFTVYGQSYLIIWNSSNSRYEIKQVNTSTGSRTQIGITSTFSSDTDLDQIYYDEANNQLVGLYKDTDLWKYNLSSNTDQIVDLGTMSYSCLIMAPTTAYVMGWNNTTTSYEIKELNLSTGGLTYLGSTSNININGNTDLNEVFYDETNNQLIGLKWGTDLWTYNLTNNTDAVVDISGADFYRSLTIANQKTYMIRWNTNKYEVYELNVTSGAVTLLGSSTTVNSSYDITEVYYDVAYNQLVALYQYKSLWRYNLSTNSDVITTMGSALYTDLAVYGDETTTPIIDPITLSDKDDEVIMIYDMTGRELPTIETNKVLILMYKSGKTKKVFITE